MCIRDRVCTACPTGAACSRRDSRDAVPCDLGTFSVGGQATCHACPAGFECPDARACAIPGYTRVQDATPRRSAARRYVCVTPARTRRRAPRRRPSWMPTTCACFGSRPLACVPRIPTTRGAVRSWRLLLLPTTCTFSSAYLSRTLPASLATRSPFARGLRSLSTPTVSAGPSAPRWRPILAPTPGAHPRPPRPPPTGLPPTSPALAPPPPASSRAPLRLARLPAPVAGATAATAGGEAPGLLWRRVVLPNDAAEL